MRTVEARGAAAAGGSGSACGRREAGAAARADGGKLGRRRVRTADGGSTSGGLDGSERSKLWAERESVQVWAKRESEQVWAKTPLVNGPDENQGGEKFTFL